MTLSGILSRISEYIPHDSVRPSPTTMAVLRDAVASLPRLVEPASFTLTLTRDIKKKGRADEWTATADGFRSGIGRTRLEAKGSFFGSNLPGLGCVELVDVDPESTMPELTWRAYNK